MVCSPRLSSNVWDPVRQPLASRSTASFTKTSMFRKPKALLTNCESRHDRILHQLRLRPRPAQDHRDLCGRHERRWFTELGRTEGYGACPDATWTDAGRAV